MDMVLVLVAFHVLLLAIPSTTVYAATQHVVGGSSGWTNTLGASGYTSWAAAQTFAVGDTLLFNYDSSTHSVAQVPKSGYDGCTASNAINTYNDGSTTIPLTTAGSMYFICPSIGHCSSGMNLAINVVAASNTSTAPSTTPSPTSSPPPPPPPKSGAADSVMFGSLLLLGTLVVHVFLG